MPGAAAMEASGGYEQDWAKALHEARIEVRIVDPKRVRSFARSAGRLAKNDPIDAEMTPPVVRAPNGVVQDSAEFFGAGNPYYDPARITVPTLLVGAEWDRDTPPYMAQTLFPLLVNSPGKRYVALAEGTHTIIMERNRLKLFEAVQAFLDEAKRS